MKLFSQENFRNSEQILDRFSKVYRFLGTGIEEGIF
jgi:hypothetical protein